MAVTSYLGKSGETLWKVSASSRSNLDLSIRVQKAKFGFATEREAEREETKLLRECEREVLSREAQGSSWEAVLQAWVKSLHEERLADTTRTDYVAAAYNHTSNWMKRPAVSITSGDIKELLNQLKAHGRTYEFIKRMKNMLGRIFQFGMERRLIKGMERVPTFGVQLGRPEEKKPEILTLAEIRKLLSSAKELAGC